MANAERGMEDVMQRSIGIMPARPIAGSYWSLVLLVLCLLLTHTGCAASNQRQSPLLLSDAPPVVLGKDDPPEAHWKAVARILERSGIARDGVYTVTVPRDDWDVSIEGMDVPVGAGLASVFHFYLCPCGKTNVVGEFCVADYELNDVIDALRAGHLEVASVGPMLLYTRVNPQIVRFQGEGHTQAIAQALREALRWTGKERMAPVTQPLLGNRRERSRG